MSSPNLCWQFVDADVLQKAGFSSRKAMKTAMYERAKVSNLALGDHNMSRKLTFDSVSMTSIEGQKNWCSFSPSSYWDSGILTLRIILAPGTG